jgi:pyridoxamine 5'-phosphate oxidase
MLDPMTTLARWIAEAEEAGSASPRTLTFSTVDVTGAPQARTVLSTRVTGEGVRFHSSSPTAKTRDLRRDPRSACVFFWPETGRQAVLHGTAREAAVEESVAAYGTRPRQLRLVAWAYDDVLREAGGGQVDPGVVSADVAAPAELVAGRVAVHAQRPEPLPMPGSWTTVDFSATRVDLWEGVGPDLAAHKTRYDRGPDGTWSATEILP